MSRSRQIRRSPQKSREPLLSGENNFSFSTDDPAAHIGDVNESWAVLLALGWQSANMARSKQAIEAGTVFAVPRPQGGYYFVIHLVSNRFGSALGILNGFDDAPVLSDRLNEVARRRYMYTGTRFARNGRWKAAGFNSALLRLFPENPEIFHHKDFHQANPSIGMYGSAETSEGALRNLTQAEADEVFLARPPYRQIMIESEFEEYLQKLLG